MAGVERSIAWRGLNHLALITNDMDATVRFWHGVLDAPLVATLATDEFRHYFFRFGNATTVAFFEYRRGESETIAKPAGVFDSRAGHFDHVSMDLPDQDALHALQARLTGAGCEVTEVVDHGMMRSIYFTDPNGIALEASCWCDDPTAEPHDFADPRYFRDPRPVPALAELCDGGLTNTPATSLVAAP